MRDASLPQVLRTMVRRAAPDGNGRVLPREPMSQATRTAVRAASYDLYQGMGAPLVVPSLDQPSPEPASGDSVQMNPLLWGPTWRIAFRMGALPVKVYEFQEQEGPDGEPGPRERVEASDHEAYQLLRRPNPDLTRPLLISGTVAGMFAFRRVCWVKERGPTGAPIALWPVGGNRMVAVSSARRIISHYELTIPAGQKRRISSEDVVDFRLMPSLMSWALGASPLDALALISGVSSSALRRMDSLFQTALVERIWLDMQGAELEPKDRERLRAEMEIARGAAEGVPIMEFGALIKTMGTGPTDEVLTRAITAADKLVERTFGMPPDPADLTWFYGEVVQPIADGMEQELERSLMPEWEDRPAFPEFQFRELLAGSPKDRAELDRIQILSGQKTINESRRDWNRPPVEGGDEPVLPLNLDLLKRIADEPEPPREKDTAGGLGGEEGQDQTTEKTPTLTAATRLRGSAGSWRRFRDRTLSRQGGALERRLRRITNDELASLRRMFGVGRAAEQPLPAADELAALVRRSDPDVARLLHGFMRQAGEEAWVEAERLIAAEAVQPLSGVVADVLDSRAAVVAERFGVHREQMVRSVIAEALNGDWTSREIGSELAARWGGLGDHLVDGIARTETAFAYEQAAVGAWRTAGIERVAFVFGGGPCRTTVCEQAGADSPYVIGEAVGDVGYSFDGADAPPLHPGCTCLLVPDGVA